MPIRIVCPKCQKQFKAPDAFAGKRGKCPVCATVIQIPAAEQPAADQQNLMDLLEQAEQAAPRQPQPERAALLRAQKSGQRQPEKKRLGHHGGWGGLPVVLVLGSASGVTAVAAPIGFWARSQPFDIEMSVATAMGAGAGLVMLAVIAIILAMACFGGGENILWLIFSRAAQMRAFQRVLTQQPLLGLAVFLLMIPGAVGGALLMDAHSKQPLRAAANPAGPGMPAPNLPRQPNQGHPAPPIGQPNPPGVPQNPAPQPQKQFSQLPADPSANGTPSPRPPRRAQEGLDRARSNLRGAGAPQP